MTTESYFFNYSATIRISGETINFEEISNTLQITPNHTHRKGDKSPLGTFYDSDMWLYDVELPREVDLDQQLKVLWTKLEPYKDFLLTLKKNLKVDIFCSYRSNSSTAGFSVTYSALQIFRELQVDFDVSVIVSADELHKAIRYVLDK